MRAVLRIKGVRATVDVPRGTRVQVYRNNENGEARTSSSDRRTTHSGLEEALQSAVPETGVTLPEFRDKLLGLELYYLDQEPVPR